MKSTFFLSFDSLKPTYYFSILLVFFLLFLIFDTHYRSSIIQLIDWAIAKETPVDMYEQSDEYLNILLEFAETDLANLLAQLKGIGI